MRVGVDFLILGGRFIVQQRLSLTQIFFSEFLLPLFLPGCLRSFAPSAVVVHWSVECIS